MNRILALALLGVCVLVQGRAYAQFGGRTELPGGVPAGTPASNLTQTNTGPYLFRIENRWDEQLNARFLHNEHVGTGNDFAEYGPAPEEWWSSYWELIPAGDSRFYIRNRWSGRYLGLISAITSGGPKGVDTWLSYIEPWLQGLQQFSLEPQVVNGIPCFRIRNDSVNVHIEHLYGYAEYSDSVPSYWWSACWIFRAYNKW